MTYDETLAYLLALEATRGWDLKLERVRAALERLGSPERAYPSLLVAGTNGKGSTAAMVHAALAAAGHRPGLYTSPHLVHFTERIRIGDAEIARDEVVRDVARIRDRVEVEGSGLTFFEVTTLLALLAFADAGVDVAVLEVGLGGRLDATNVVEPIASAVVGIDYDHEDYLGPTLASIAREKAGVMRGGRVTVLGGGIADEARSALLGEARRIGAHVVEATGASRRLPPLALAGDHMRRNALVACRLLEAAAAVEPRFAVDGSALERGLQEVRWPGRLAVVREAPRVVVDCAHNPAAAEALVAALPAVAGDGRVRLLFSALRDKHWREMAAVLAPVAAEVVVTEVAGKRRLPAIEIATAFPGARTIVDPARALRCMVEEDAVTPILVTGSLFLVGMVYADLMAERGIASVFDYPVRDAS